MATHCFSYIFFRLMHVSASRFFPSLLKSFACLISLSIFRIRCSSRFSIVSDASRSLPIASLVELPPLLFPEGVGAAAFGFERPNKFMPPGQQRKHAAGGAVRGATSSFQLSVGRPHLTTSM